MSKQFLVDNVNSTALVEARKQAKQIAYLTQSSIQQEITAAYLNQWAERNFVGTDYFLNWVKAVLRTENFLHFYKYFRHPIASSAVINNKILPALERVFFADDSYFRYNIGNEEVTSVEELGSPEFDEVVFEAVIFRHNDIFWYDYEDINKPIRKLIDIENVYAIDCGRNDIYQIAIKGVHEGKAVIIYANQTEYIIYNYAFEPLAVIPHDLGLCPADFVSKDPLNSKKNNVVRKSLFSYSIEKLEEYVFLKTLQRMTEANGAIPITTEIKSDKKKTEGEQAKALPAEPMSTALIKGHNGEIAGNVLGQQSDNVLMAGTRIKIPPIRKQDGSYDMDAIKHFVNFFYTPIEALEYLNSRVENIEKDLMIDLIGDYSEDNEAAKNVLQVSKGFKSKQDKLRKQSELMSWLRTRSDKKMLLMLLANQNITVEGTYGTDFFLESQQELYKMFAESPNAIERKSILIRLVRNRNKDNIKRGEKDELMYKLLPFASDIDFDKALEYNKVGDITFQMQTRMDYYLSIFESRYGDICYFYNMLESEESVRLVTISNLLINIIKEYYEKPEIPEGSVTPESV